MFSVLGGWARFNSLGGKPWLFFSPVLETTESCIEMNETAVFLHAALMPIRMQTKHWLAAVEGASTYWPGQWWICFCRNVRSFMIRHCTYMSLQRHTKYLYNFDIAFFIRCGCLQLKPRDWRSLEPSLAARVTCTWTWASPIRPCNTWPTSLSSSTRTGQWDDLWEKLFSTTTSFLVTQVFLYFLHLKMPCCLLTVIKLWLIVKFVVFCSKYRR